MRAFAALLLPSQMDCVHEAQTWSQSETCLRQDSNTSLSTGASANATYRNFTSDRIIHAPTDISWVIARVLVFDDSDTAAANRLLGNITISSYNVTGTVTIHGMAGIVTSFCICADSQRQQNLAC